jgi:SH3-like domain-containing protein
MRLLLALLLLLLPTAATAQLREAEQGLSGLPVPRFVSLGAGEANMRSGPGERYPITWVYQRRGLPLEVIREWGIWRLVRDPQGGKGWMNKNLISGERTAYVTRTIRTLHQRPDVASPVVWRLEPGVVAKIVLCEEAWCQLSIDGKSGYILRNQIWGVYPSESID